MSELAVPTRSTNYTTEEIERGLHALALCSGNTRKAEKLTTDAGSRIPASTLKDWKLHHYPDRYEAIKEAELPAIRQRIAEGFDNIVSLSQSIQEKALTQLSDKIDDLEPQYLAKTAQSAAVIGGISTDKGLLLRGEPTAITQSKSAAEILTDLAKKHPGLINVNQDFIDTTAEEVKHD